MTLPTLTELGTTNGFTAGDINTKGLVVMVPAYQKVYFADGRTPTTSIHTSGYHKLDFLNTRITASTNPAWTKGQSVSQDTLGDATKIAAGIVDEIVDRGSGVFWILVYRTTLVEFVTTKPIVPSPSGTTLAAVNISAIVAPPHWLSWVPTVGDLPEGGSSIGCLCFGRIFLNDLFHPNQWFASRIGDPLDWDVSGDDIAAATSSQTSDAGIVGEELTALIPYQDHYLFFGTVNQVWLLRSDPKSGGILTQISTSTGIFSNSAWCWDNMGNLYFIGNDGIYMVGMGDALDGKGPVNLTKQRMPKLIASLNLNRRTDRIAMEYDKLRHGILISISQLDSQWGVTLWLDLRQNGVFPDVYQSDHIPASLLFYDSRVASNRLMLMGGQDGYIRKYDENEENDDGGNAINSYVVIGPLVMSSDPRGQGKLNELSITTNSKTDGITVSLYKAKTAQELIDLVRSNADPVFTKEFEGSGLYASLRQRIVGSMLAIRLSNGNTDETWGIERIIGDILSAGRVK